jgi:PST family polysaccharide transporter
MLVTTTLSLYYLPRIAEIHSAPELKKEIIKIYCVVMPIVTVGALTIFLLKDFIILSLFTLDFLPIRELFPWQLAGDVIKIGSCVFAYIMLGRAMVKTFLITEIATGISFCLLSWIFVTKFGLIGVSMAYAINYSLYWAGMAYLVKYEMRQMSVITQ